jgi:phage tail sheath protein FI
MKLIAASVGSWGMNLQITVEDSSKTKDPTDTRLFNLTVFDNNLATAADSDKRGGSGAKEPFLNLSADPNSSRFIKTILEQHSNLVRFQSNGGGNAPSAQANTAADANSGKDGVSTTTPSNAAAEVDGDSSAKTGIYALQKTDLFNLLCIAPLTVAASSSLVPTTEADIPMTTWTKAADLCKKRRALLLVDAPTNWNPTTAQTNISGFSAIERTNAALYFPRLRIPDPLQENNLADFAPCGAVAGVMSRTDTERGVWKAPAGIDASLRGVSGLSIAGAEATLNDGENGDLNPLGINCIRSFPAIGHIVWGARTLAGADIQASDWKYVPVRRTALFLEESLYRGTQWVVFEPNDEPLWAQIRLNVGAFMHTLFRQGAFAGTIPHDAYFVKCDRETTTQTDVNLGVVNILVGFAPLKPAEFVFIKLQQMAGQIQT